MAMTLPRFVILVASITSMGATRDVQSRQSTSCPESPPEECYCTQPYRPHMVCSGHGLTSLPDFDWSSADLHTLDLSRNNLTGDIDLSLFGNLRRLILKDNEITGLIVTPGTEGNLTIEYLDVSNNALQAVPEMLGDMSRLESLDLSDNHIGQINWSIFGSSNGPSQLNWLYLDGNPVTGYLGPADLPYLQGLYFTPLPGPSPIPGQFLVSIPQFPRLQRLSITGRPISFTMSENWFGEELRHLTYNSNSKVSVQSLQDIPVQVLGPQIQSLSLANNSLRSKKSFWNWLGGFTELSTLDLSGNKFTKLDGFLATLSNLELLNLSGNKASRISTALFTELPFLREIDIRNNNLVEIDLNDHVSDIDSNLLIRLAGNKWLCDCNLVWMKELMARQLTGDAWNFAPHEMYHEITCYDPPHLRNRLIMDVDDSDMPC